MTSLVEARMAQTFTNVCTEQTAKGRHPAYAGNI